jgi:hypothetical protein
MNLFLDCLIQIYRPCFGCTIICSFLIGRGLFVGVNVAKVIDWGRSFIGWNERIMSIGRAIGCESCVIVALTE